MCVRTLPSLLVLHKNWVIFITCKRNLVFSKTTFKKLDVIWYGISFFPKSYTYKRTFKSYTYKQSQLSYFLTMRQILVELPTKEQVFSIHLCICTKSAKFLKFMKIILAFYTYVLLRSYSIRSTAIFPQLYIIIFIKMFSKCLLSISISTCTCYQVFALGMYYQLSVLIVSSAW